MPKGLFGVPRPFAQSELVILFKVNIDNEIVFEQLSKEIKKNKDRLESKTAFNLEDKLNTSVTTFGVDRVLILFGGEEMLYRVETSEERISDKTINTMFNEIIRTMQQNTESEPVKQEVELSFDVGTGEMGLIEQ